MSSVITGQKPLALVTGASSGIGYELAICCARAGYDLLVAADDLKIEEAAQYFRTLGVKADSVFCDLSTVQGVDELYQAKGERPIEALLANAGHGLGGPFLDQPFSQARHVVDTNITGTIYLIQKVGVEMRNQGRGRILITGSIAGFTPGTFSAVYNGTKAFIDSFSFALRSELRDSGVTVTCLMPGATETEFFERAGMLDTEIGQSEKDDAAYVARVGFEAMMRGDGDVVSGLKNKFLSAVSTITPSGILAEQHRKKAEPGSGFRKQEGYSLTVPLIAGGVLAGAGLAYALLRDGRGSSMKSNGQS